MKSVCWSLLGLLDRSNINWRKPREVRWQACQWSGWCFGSRCQWCPRVGEKSGYSCISCTASVALDNMPQTQHITDEIITKYFACHGSGGGTLLQTPLFSTVLRDGTLSKMMKLGNKFLFYLTLCTSSSTQCLKTLLKLGHTHSRDTFKRIEVMLEVPGSPVYYSWRKRTLTVRLWMACSFDNTQICDDSGPKHICNYYRGREGSKLFRYTTLEARSWQDQ